METAIEPSTSSQQEAQNLTGHIESLDAEEGTPPLLRTLYVLEHGLNVFRKGERLVVSFTRNIPPIHDIPIHKLDQIVLQANACITTGALSLCAEHEVSICFADHGGHCYAMLDTLAASAVELRRDQFLNHLDDTRRLTLARAFVVGKIANARRLITRYGRNHTLPKLDAQTLELATMEQHAEQSTHTEHLQGCEGNAARIYFGALADMLPAEWAFDGRTRQPPADPFNAMLSYGYAMLFSTVSHLIRQRGLDPHIGYLHALRDRHAALASDLMEEFRALIVDTTVLQLVFSNHVKPADFTQEETGFCRMNNETRKRLIHALERRLNTEITHPIAHLKMDYRRAIRYQVHHLAQVIQDRSVYQPFVLP